MCGRCGGRAEPGLGVSLTGAVRQAPLRTGPPRLLPKQAASPGAPRGAQRGASHCPGQPAEDRRGRGQALQALAGRASWEEPVGAGQAGSGRGAEPLLNTRLQYLQLQQGGLHLEEEEVQCQG